MRGRGDLAHAAGDPHPLRLGGGGGGPSRNRGPGGPQRSYAGCRDQGREGLNQAQGGNHEGFRGGSQGGYRQIQQAPQQLQHQRFLLPIIFARYSSCRLRLRRTRVLSPVGRLILGRTQRGSSRRARLFRVHNKVGSPRTPQLHLLGAREI